MAFIIKDRVKEGTVTTGTGAFALGGAASTFEAFTTYMSNGDTAYYAVVHTASGVDEWEVGLGTFNTGNTLTRTTILSSSNSGNAVSFSSGTKDIFMTYPADRAVIEEPNRSVSFPAGISVTGNVAASGTIDGRDVAADGTKLDGIETAATADQTAAEIRTLVESATDSNVFTDADHTKLNAIEAGATADQTKSDIEGLGIDVPAANLTGTIAAARLSTAATQAESDDSTKIATTAYVTDKIETLIGGAPGTLNDLNELAAAINDDANYNSTLTTALGTKLPKSGGTMTGDIDGNGNKVLFANVYSTEGDLPSASTYHGMFAHVHSTGAGYFAHAGSWVKLANNSQISDENFTTADHSKLDGIEANATADQTAAQILTALKTVDGSGSGLDADLIDGLSSDAFIRSNAADVKSSGDLNFSDGVKATFGASSDLQIYHDGSNSVIKDNGTGNIRIQSTGIVQIGDEAFNETFAQFNDDGAVQLYHNNAVKFATTSSGISVSGNVAVTGTVDGRDVATDGSKLDGIASGATNTVGNATHTGEVTGSGALTIANNVVDAGNLKVTGNGSSTQFLRSDGDGTFTWATPTDTNTVYSHPTHPGDDASVDTGALTGATVISDLDFNITTDTLGHVTDANATVATRNITLANLGYTGATNANNSTSNATHTGEVTGSGALTIANNVVDAGNLKVTGNGTTSQFLRSDGDGTFTWATPTDTNTTYSVGDGGLTQKNFTSTLKTKLDGIETGATADQTPAQLLAAIKTVDVNGSGGLNAGRLDGHALTTASTGSTVVERDSSGDIHARLFRSEYDSTNSSIGYIMTQVDTASNNYVRPSTPAQVRSTLNVANGANNYSHPTGNGNNHIPSGGSSGQILQYSSAGTAAWAAAPAGGIKGMNWGYYRSPTGNTANGTHTITMNPYSYVQFTGYTYNRVDVQVAGTNVLPRFNGAGYGGSGGFSLIYNNNTASSVTLGIVFFSSGSSGYFIRNLYNTVP